MVLSRVFSVDILECPGCGSRRQVIAVVMAPSVVRTLLEARGLPAEPPATGAAATPARVRRSRRRAVAWLVPRS